MAGYKCVPSPHTHTRTHARGVTCKFKLAPISVTSTQRPDREPALPHTYDTRTLL